MKQIGARQEAGRIGGTGPCGRELCCATWMKNFISVSTNSARFQDISLNPQKLAGMCAKLKCCLNYEVDDYVEAGRRIPSKEVILQTIDSDYFLFKTDILAGLITYSTDKNIAANLETITAERARTIIEMNKRGEKPDTLHEDGKQRQAGKQHIDLLAGENINRFDKAKKKKKKKKPANQQQQETASKAPANTQQQEAATKKQNSPNKQNEGERKRNDNHPKRAPQQQRKPNNKHQEEGNRQRQNEKDNVQK